jgi:aromatase
MQQSGSREVEHETTVRAPAAHVYQLIAEVESWPSIFPPTVYVDYLERSAAEERIRIWATANGEAKSWVSRRQLDPEKLRIDFRQEVSAPPVAAMGGGWVIEPMSKGECRVRLLHDYRAVDDDPDDLAWIDKAVDRNSTSELNALKANVERISGAPELMMTFDDSVHVDGSAKDVFDFINEAQLWTERLPHVVRVTLREDTPGLQRLEMDTKTKDGSTHTTESIRVCLPHTRIAYKQIRVPPLLTLHTGQWLLEESSQGVAVTSRHTVVINEPNVPKILGDDASVRDAKNYVRSALGANSRATLGHAKTYAEHQG